MHLLVLGTLKNYNLPPGKTAYSRHLYETHGQDVDCRCALCDKFFIDSTALNRHDKRVHGMVAEEPHCADCELYFSRVSLYNRHNHEKHAMDPEFYCETCDKYFDDNPKLRRHKWQVHGGTEAHLTCDDCSIEFSRRSQYNR